jgi:hypothetical protein
MVNHGDARQGVVHGHSRKGGRPFEMTAVKEKCAHRARYSSPMDASFC